jgi:hypothetical protein
MAGDVMAAGKTLTVYLAADLKKFNKGMTQARGGIKGFGDSLSKLAGPALIAAGAAAGAFAVKLGVDAVNAASDLAETQNKVGVIFGQSSEQMLAFADDAVTALGQTRTQALEGAATFAQFGKSAGISGQSLVDFSSELVTLSADLASFNNSSPDEAINAIGSALRGEAEPMRKFGVLLDDATLKAKALEMGIYEGTGSLTQQQKVLAAHQVILAQTTDAQGDFARTSDGLANTQRILSAAVEDAKAEIGEGLVDAIESATKAMGGSQGMASIIGNTAENVGDLTRGIGVLVGQLAELETQSGDTEEETTTLAESIFSVINMNPIIRQYTLLGDALIGVGEQARETATMINAVYDSTIAMAQAARIAAAEQNIANRGLADSAYDSGIAALKQADYIARLTKILGHAPGVITTTTNATTKLTGSTGSAADATDKLTKKQRALIALNEDVAESYSNTADKLNTRMAKLNENLGILGSMQDKLTAGLDLAAAFEGQFDEAGAATGVSLLEGFNKQIDQANYFGEVLNAIKAQGADQSLIEQIASLGPVTGAALATQMLDDGLVPTLNEKWMTVQETTKGLAMGLVPEFVSAGIESGAAAVDGLATQLAKEGKRLTKLGKRMAKPVGSAFKSQLAKDIAEAIANVEAAGTAARASAIAKAEAREAAVTQQQVALAIGNIIRQSDARSGTQVSPVLA